jgi:hypothetical protein
MSLVSLEKNIPILQLSPLDIAVSQIQIGLQRVKAGCLSDEKFDRLPPEADRVDRPDGPDHAGSGNVG